MTSNNSKVDTDPAGAPDKGVGCGALVRRLGRFSVAQCLLREQPETLKPLFSEMIVVEAQVRWYDRVEYLAMSDRFEAIPEGVMAPLYDITFRRDSDGRVTMHEVTKAILPTLNAQTRRGAAPELSVAHGWPLQTNNENQTQRKTLGTRQTLRPVRG